jgi:hypothetical protein
MGEPDIAADDRSRADAGIAAENRGAGIDGDIILDGGMPLRAAQFLSTGGGARAKGDAVVDFNAVADDTRLADDNARAVIHEKGDADFGAGMDIDAGAAVCPFSHHAGNERDAQLVEDMGDAVDGKGFKAWISEDDLLDTGGRGISIESGFGVFLEDGADRNELFKESFYDFCGVEILDGGEVDAFADLRFKAFGNGAESIMGDRGEGVWGNSVFTPKSGEEEVKEFFDDSGDAGFGGEVYAADMVDAAVFGVGIQECIDQSLYVHYGRIAHSFNKNQPSSMALKLGLAGKDGDPAFFIFGDEGVAVEMKDFVNVVGAGGDGASGALGDAGVEFSFFDAPRS